MFKGLENKTIVKVIEIPKKINDMMGWDSRPSGVAIVLDDGKMIFASKDEEGNGVGTLLILDELNDCYMIG